MTTALRLDPGSAVPPFEQLRGQLARRIRDGVLPPGATLPPVRRLASELGLAPNTVARCYQELQREGLVVARGRNGTVVAEPATVERAGWLAAQEYVRAVTALGIHPAEAVALVESVLRDRAGAGADPQLTPP